jgi:hypothetical protein
MRLSWDIDVLIKLLVTNSRKLTNVFNDILKEYGYEKIVELGIDLYGGCFNEVVQISRHSWGIAIDLDLLEIY